MSDRLSALDAAFLQVEDRDNRMHLAGVLTFAGAAPDFAEFRAEIARKLPSLPHFRHRLKLSRLSRPQWVEDESFDLDCHVRHVALPAPGGHAEVAALIDAMTAAPLDLARPLWEIALVEGVAGGFGLSLKVHHCMVDGLSIIDIFGALCSPAGDVPQPRLTLAPPVVERERFATARRMQRTRRALGAAPVTRLNTGRSGPCRRTEYLSIPLSDVNAIRRAHATTINNVVLAIVAGALRRYFARTGEQHDAVRAFVPVNKRPEHARGTHGNQIGMTYPALPVGEPDLSRRIELVQQSVAASNQARQADDFAALMHLGRFAPAPLAGALNRALQFRGGMFNLTVTNVPGPPVPVFFLGRELTAILGATPLTRRHALTIAVLSYNGELTFCVTTDPRRLPDGSALHDDLRSELDSLRTNLTIGARHA